MEECSRPATLDDLKTLLRSLNQHHVDYFLSDGYALAAHGYQRATTILILWFRLMPRRENESKMLC